MGLELAVATAHHCMGAVVRTQQTLAKENQVLDLVKLRRIHRTKGLHLATSSGLSGVIDIGGDRELPVTMLLDECDKSAEKDSRIAALEWAAPTPHAYAAACKALAHWRREAKRLGRLAGVKPREMRR